MVCLCYGEALKPVEDGRQSRGHGLIPVHAQPIQGLRAGMMPETQVLSVII